MEMGEEDRVAEMTGGGRGKKRRRKAAARRTPAGGWLEGEVEAMLWEFMRLQMEMEERWMG